MSADMAAFFRLHDGLPREGPGEAADVAWAAGIAGLAPDAAICDAGCGPGADIAALRAAAPEGHVTAFDLHPPFVEAARARHADDPGVRALRGRLIPDPADDLPDPAALGPFDLIWSAGAAYSVGVSACLEAWRGALRPGGRVAVSDAVWFTDTPAPEVAAFWTEYPGMTDPAGFEDRARAAGYEVLGTRVLSDAAWEAYYGPLDARVAALRPGADPAMAEVLDAQEAEAALWRSHRDAFGYLLAVLAAP